jgi:hypothetical protein
MKERKVAILIIAERHDKKKAGDNYNYNYNYNSNSTEKKKAGAQIKVRWRPAGAPLDF